MTLFFITTSHDTWSIKTHCFAELLGMSGIVAYFHLPCVHIRFVDEFFGLSAGSQNENDTTFFAREINIWRLVFSRAGVNIRFLPPHYSSKRSFSISFSCSPSLISALFFTGLLYCRTTWRFEVCTYSHALKLSLYSGTFYICRIKCLKGRKERVSDSISDKWNVDFRITLVKKGRKVEALDDYPGGYDWAILRAARMVRRREQPFGASLG